MNALEIIQQVCATVGLNVPSTIVTATDSESARITAITNRAIAMIRREHPWQALQRDISFNAFINNYAFDKDGLKIKTLIPDYDYMASKCIYQVNNLEPVKYLEPSAFLALQSGALELVGKRFTILGNKFKFLPALTENDFNLSLTYQSNSAVIDTENKTGYKQLFNKDSDICEFDEELLILAAIYKYKQELGLSYAEAMADYQARLDTLKNTDSAMDIIAPYTDGGIMLNIPNTCLAEVD